MAITVIVRSASGDDPGLTFDGTQRVVIGRGASCDVRLPDASVSHRHASLRAQGADFLLVDEGSTNGTFVGGVRIAARTSRIVRAGDLVRLGRVWLEMRIDHGPVTRDVAAATRDLALALVSRAMAAQGVDATVRIRVVEGRDQGTALPLAAEGRAYVIGRAAECDLPLADADVSREHVEVGRRAGSVVLRDLGAKNGTWLGDARLPAGGEAAWRPTQMVRIGRTVLAVEEPVGDALADIESAPDEALPADPAGAPPAPAKQAPQQAEPPSGSASSPASVSTSAAAPAAPLAPPSPGPVAATPSARRAARGTWSAVDIAIMAAALGVLALSIAGLFWLLHG